MKPRSLRSSLSGVHPLSLRSRLNSFQVALSTTKCHCFSRSAGLTSRLCSTNTWLMVFLLAGEMLSFLKDFEGLGVQRAEAFPLRKPSFIDSKAFLAVGN